VRTALGAIRDTIRPYARELLRAGADGIYFATVDWATRDRLSALEYGRLAREDDLDVLSAVQSGEFNILHVCDYVAPYADLGAFTDYPGDLVSCSPQLTTGTVSMQELARHFGRPVMGGMDRKGALAAGSTEEVRLEAETVLRDAPDRFVLGADCTVPGEGRWEAIREAVATAHAWPRG